MAALTIDLPDDVRESVSARAAASGYARVEDYVRDVIVAGVGDPLPEELEEKLLKALDSPGRIVTRAEWEEKARQLIERHEGKSR